jgi:hypothetical protein
MKNLRFIVVHSPGPNWKPGVPAFEQDGLQLHVGHYATLLKPGKLLMGGPFMDGRDTDGSQSERCTGTPGQKTIAAILRRRGLLLLAVGFLNLTIWEGDILRVYGVSLLIVP